MTGTHEFPNRSGLGATRISPPAMRGITTEWSTVATQTTAGRRVYAFGITSKSLHAARDAGRIITMQRKDASGGGAAGAVGEVSSAITNPSAAVPAQKKQGHHT